MESLSLEQREIVIDILDQILTSLDNLLEWNKNVKNQNDLLLSSDGMQKVAGNCMLIQAICEGFKQIDKRTDSQLLSLRPEIPWRQVKGMRDRIAHGYFDLDVDYIDDIIKHDLLPIREASVYFQEYLKSQNNIHDDIK